jgi:hypothetical protein
VSKANPDYDLVQVRLRRFVDKKKSRSVWRTYLPDSISFIRVHSKDLDGDLLPVSMTTKYIRERRTINGYLWRFVFFFEVEEACGREEARTHAHALQQQNL